MSDVAPTGRPPWSVVAWVDSTRVYIELPSATGVPYITAYPLTEGGLSKALSTMRDAHRQAQPLGGDYHIPLNPMMKGQRPQAYTPESRAKARDILRRLKIT